MTPHGLLWLRSLAGGEKCAACGELRTGGEELLCPECTHDFRASRMKICPECGVPYAYCRCVPPPLREAGAELLIKLAEYEPARRDSSVRRVVLHLKDRRDGMLAAFAAEYLSRGVLSVLEARELAPENCVVTFVPRSAGAALNAGTDQARLLARKLSRACGARFVPLIGRTRRGGQQKTLTFEEREENVRGLYRMKKPLPPCAAVLVVDDIVTSGATMAAVTRCLRDAGAETVFGVCIARTMK